MNEFQLGFCQNEDFFGKTSSARHIRTGLCSASRRYRRGRPHDMEKLLECIKIQSVCSSEYVVEIYGFIEERERVYVLMEYHDEGRLLLKLKSHRH
jgi:hypothetical protein